MEPQTLFVLGMALGFIFGGIVGAFVALGFRERQLQKLDEDRAQVARSVEGQKGEAAWSSGSSAGS